MHEDRRNWVVSEELEEILDPAAGAARDPLLAADARAGTGLCLSGGGLRAMLFHVGMLWRLNEAGLLAKVERVSSVSGGSVVAATLALAWPELRASGFDPAVYRRLVADRLTAFASERVNLVALVLLGLVTPGGANARFAHLYARRLFGERTLQDLPAPGEGPEFIFNATSLETGVLWRFSRGYLRNYEIGGANAPRIQLARVVAASSAFPPILSPARFDFGAEEMRPWPDARRGIAPFTRAAVMSDGGVYDNLGLEPVWKRCAVTLVSDAGKLMAAEGTPKVNWLSQAMRINDIMDSQVRDLRLRMLKALQVQGRHTGAFWSIATPLSAYGKHASALPCPDAATAALANLNTTSECLDAPTQQRLINWGYAASDASLRAHLDPGLAQPAGFPFPAAGV